ncbi:L-allo-threonine aldolase, putative [Ixodes scapularis]|uniref:L-allo-threonine aldolase, putative n=1 Tax=Ixodes scapularis TaxID=6945 RepID=B7Q013_IXOSC|nr:L-allo-threonine aldolase, putative [Ixodes scapularis]|eukprot:XP_002406697.1 L-allo-threonine aldolase, putative [Ixodes scapularis]
MDAFRVVDLRSDTVTQPTLEMRQAMKDAVVGDDVFKEDPTVNELERVVAELFGKEAALLVPTGTMGNLASGKVKYLGFEREQRGPSLNFFFIFATFFVFQIAGMRTWAVPTEADGSLLIEDLLSRVRQSELQHHPIPSLLCLENTHNVCGGTVLPIEYLNKVLFGILSFGKHSKIPIHMDGARIMNAATYLDQPVAEIVKGCDSVMMCLTKGLACPGGSVVAGSKEYVQGVSRARKVLGGAMTQVGILAAAGLVALKTMVPRLREDHENTQRLARGVCLEQNPFISINLNTVQTNIAIIDFTDDLSPVTFCEHDSISRICIYVLQVSPRELEDLDEAIVVKMLPYGPTKARAVLHKDISTDDVDAAVTKIRYILNELCRHVPAY